MRCTQTAVNSSLARVCLRFLYKMYENNSRDIEALNCNLKSHCETKFGINALTIIGKHAIVTEITVKKDRGCVFY